jgi:hypothetical protein
MPQSPQQNIKIIGKTCGATLGRSILNAGNVAIANAFRNIGDFFSSIGIGTRGFNGVTSAGGVLASGTITLSSSAAADTVTINGTVFTETSGAPTGNQFQHGATDTITAANLAAAINGSATAIVANNVSASSAGAVVTITSKESGTVGNLMTLAISAHGSVSGANLTGGTDGTVTALAKGL